MERLRLVPQEVAESYMNGNITWTLDRLEERSMGFTLEVLTELGRAGSTHRMSLEAAIYRRSINKR